MTSSALDQLFVGPAVVVDDKIEDEESEMARLALEIEAENLPVLRRTALPSTDQVMHWRGFSLILLDWELLPLPAPDETLPAGIRVPSELEAEYVSVNTAFIECLLNELYCPVFIVSSKDLGEIWDALEDGLGRSKEDLESRIFVRAKSDLQGVLFHELSQWLEAHPAIYAAKNWEQGYERAKSSMFRDFHASSTHWPRILWEAAETDRVNASFYLAETISKNLLHRLDPAAFDEAVIKRTSDDDPMNAVRAVIHRQAVIPGDKLYSDVLMPGDYFYGDDQLGADELPDSLRINITPACDLVRRGDEPVRLYLVTATRVPPADYSNREKKDKLVKTSQIESEVVHVLNDKAVPYRVMFKTLEVVEWPDIESHRRGRLLEPYISLLQQRHALYFHRYGLPRLPKAWY